MFDEILNKVADQGLTEALSVAMWKHVDGAENWNICSVPVKDKVALVIITSPDGDALMQKMADGLKEAEKLRAANAKLLRVKEAAERVKEWLPDLEPIRGTPRDTDHNKAAWELREALRALDEEGK